MQQVNGPANPAANPANMGTGAAPAPAGGPIPGTASSLDSYVNMFKPKPADPNAPKAPTLQDPILGPMDPSAFRQQISTANFASGIPAETIQKAVSGDVNAFSEAINLGGAWLTHCGRKVEWHSGFANPQFPDQDTKY
jgi:hypothetical protein